MNAIRVARLSDVGPILDFDYFDHDPAREISEGRMLVAELGGRITGFVSWQPNGFVGRNYVTFLYVDERERRNGLGRQLLRAATVQLDCGRLFVSTEVNNKAMIQLLASDGWVEAGTVEGANDDGTAEVFFFRDPDV